MGGPEFEAKVLMLITASTSQATQEGWTPCGQSESEGYVDYVVARFWGDAWSQDETCRRYYATAASSYPAHFLLHQLVLNQILVALWSEQKRSEAQAVGRNIMRRVLADLDEKRVR